jgi:hypothetical protein
MVRGRSHPFAGRWGVVDIDVEGGVEQALEIFKLNYDLIAKKKGLE